MDQCTADGLFDSRNSALAFLAETRYKSKVRNPATHAIAMIHKHACLLGNPTTCPFQSINPAHAAFVLPFASAKEASILLNTRTNYCPWPTRPLSTRASTCCSCNLHFYQLFEGKYSYGTMRLLRAQQERLVSLKACTATATLHTHSTLLEKYIAAAATDKATCSYHNPN